MVSPLYKFTFFVLFPAIVFMLDTRFSIPTYAQSASIGDQVCVPRSACYIGLGGRLNSINFGTQDVIAIGQSTITMTDSTGNPYVAAEGYAQGPDDANGGTPIYMDSVLTFSPSVELGYFQHFAGSSSRLWGIKFTNDYFGATSNIRDIRLPQVGEFNKRDPIEDPNAPFVTIEFTGNAVAVSAKTRMIDQISLRPYLGRSFRRGFVYVGGGPTVSYMRTEIQDLVGFADINHRATEISGPPQDFMDSGWVWGGSAEVGVTYFLCRSWFLDCSYLFAITGDRTFNFSSTFENENSPLGNLTGSLIGSSTWNAISQSFGIRLCRAF